MENLNLPWEEAIRKVLEEAEFPMHYEEITKRIIELKFRSSLGPPPASTVNARITFSIKKYGDSSPYTRVLSETGRGFYSLRNKPERTNVPGQKKTGPPVPVDEPLEIIIQAFGMYWKRDQIDWEGKNSCKILGNQKNADVQVDCGKQKGIYLLYDGREVIYVGRSVDRPIGVRLFEHTKDRHGSRWDRFSWFGLLPVSENGDLEEKKEFEKIQLGTLIAAFESILIESLETPQNRKGGDNLEVREFIQVPDPEINKKTLMAAVGRL